MKQNKSDSAKIVGLLVALIILIPSVWYAGYTYGGAISSPGTTYGPGDIDGYSYIVFKEGSNYYAKNGTTRIVDYGPSTSASDLFTNVIANAGLGTSILVKDAYYEITNTITIPDGTKSLTIIGESKQGKDETGTSSSGTHLHATFDGPIFQNEYTNDVRSVYGLHFEKLKFSGTANSGSTAIHARNVDGLTIHDSAFFDFYTAITFEYIGVTYPIAEQPGWLEVDYSIFTEGNYEAIRIVRSTQNHITNNIFWGWGPYRRYLNLTGTDKTFIIGNEFDAGSNTAVQEEHILLNSISAIYDVTDVTIEANWVWREANNYPFIRTTGNAYTVSNVISEGNIIHHGYTPNVLTDIGPYVIGNASAHQINARDYINPFSSQLTRLSDYTGAWTPGTARQNKWSPMEVLLTVELDNGESLQVDMSYKSTTLWTVLATSYNAGVGTDKRTLTFTVPTLFYWNVTTTGSVTGLVASWW